MVEQVNYDCALLEFYEEISEVPILLLPNQQVSVKKYFPDYTSTDYPIKSFSCSDNWKVDIFPIGELLELGKGKLSLCGSIINKLIRKHGPSDHDDFNLFFHSCGENEIKQIIESCIQYLRDNTCIGEMKEDQKTIKIKFSFAPSIVFYLYPYKDEIDVLQNTECTSDKLLWNPITGCHCTIVSGLIHSLYENTRFSPMRIKDYYDDKYFVDIEEILYNNYVCLIAITEMFNLCFDITKIIYPMWCILLLVRAKTRLLN
jgi:hypothetical protein